MNARQLALVVLLHHRLERQLGYRAGVVRHHQLGQCDLRAAQRGAGGEGIGQLGGFGFGGGQVGLRAQLALRCVRGFMGEQAPALHGGGPKARRVQVDGGAALQAAGTGGVGAGFGRCGDVDLDALRVEAEAGRQLVEQHAGE